MHDVIFFNFLSNSDFLYRFASSKRSETIYCSEDTSIIHWPPRRVTALQVVRTSFLGLRPRLFPPPPSPPLIDTNVLNHTTRKNNILYNPLLKLAWKKRDTFNNLLTFPIFRTLKCAFPISAFFRPIPCDIPDTDKNVKKSCFYK